MEFTHDVISLDSGSSSFHLPERREVYTFLFLFDRLLRMISTFEEPILCSSPIKAQSRSLIDSSFGKSSSSLHPVNHFQTQHIDKKRTRHNRATRNGVVADLVVMIIMQWNPLVKRTNPSGNSDSPAE